MNEQQIEAFWGDHPCGNALVGGLDERFRGDYESFFAAYDNWRYKIENHIPECLSNICFKGKTVLEIGLGQGADSEQIIRRGGIWYGLDLTEASINRVAARLSLRGLPYKALKQGTVLSIPYQSDSFDIVFSHGVLHHVPDIRTAQAEIARVLKPKGELVVMLYAKWSLNYLFSISLLRRLGLLVLRLLRPDVGGIYGQHLANAREMGIRRYLHMENFIHRNTDGPHNPYSKVYDCQEIKRDFPDFEIIKTYRRFMHAPPLPVHGMPLGRLLGWHLWAHLKPLIAQNQPCDRGVRAGA